MRSERARVSDRAGSRVSVSQTHAVQLMETACVYEAFSSSQCGSKAVVSFQPHEDSPELK